MDSEEYVPVYETDYVSAGVDEWVTVEGRRFTPAAYESRRVATISRRFEHSQETDVESAERFYEQIQELMRQ